MKRLLITAGVTSISSFICLCNRILCHYADDFEIRSPLIVERMGIAEGLLKGKEAIRPYCQRELDR